MEREGVKKTDIVWNRADNETETYSSYHGYYNRTRKGLYFYKDNYEGYKGSAALCNKNMGISEDGEVFIPTNELENHGLQRKYVCKRCLKIYDNLKE